MPFTPWLHSPNHKVISLDYRRTIFESIIAFDAIANQALGYFLRNRSPQFKRSISTLENFDIGDFDPSLGD